MRDCDLSSKSIVTSLLVLGETLLHTSQSKISEKSTESERVVGRAFLNRFRFVFNSLLLFYDYLKIFVTLPLCSRFNSVPPFFINRLSMAINLNKET